MSCRPALEKAVDDMKQYTLTDQDLCNIVINATIADGHKIGFTIEEVGSASYPANDGQWVVALALMYDVENNAFDYHWWRRTTYGCWLQIKMNPPVLPFDESNNVIYDPQTCNRGDYTVWGGYFLVTPTN